MSWTVTDDYLGPPPDDGYAGGLGGYEGPEPDVGANLPGTQDWGGNIAFASDQGASPGVPYDNGRRQSGTGLYTDYAPFNTNSPQGLETIANQNTSANLRQNNWGQGAGAAGAVPTGAFNTNDPAGLEAIARQNAASIYHNANQGAGAGAFTGREATPQAGAVGTVGAGLPGTGGPQAMAAGEGWYVDSHGRFISDNMGANARANTSYDLNPTIGPGTILDFPGGSRSAVGVGQGLGQGLQTAGDFLAGRDRYGNPNRLPDYLGLNGQPMGQAGFGGLALPGAAPPNRNDLLGGVTTQAALAAAGVPNATGVPLGGGGGPLGSINNTGPFANFIPRRGDTLSETYGPFGGAAAAGPATQAGGRGQTLSDRARIVTDDQGRVVAVRDPDGYIAPGGQWSTKREILQNIFDPGAREKLALLGRMGDMDALTALSGLNPDMINSQQAANVFEAHNADIRRGAPGIAWNPPANPVADTAAFPVEYALIDVMRKDGVPVSNTLVNGNIAYQDSNGQTRYIPAWQAGQKLAEYQATQAAQAPAQAPAANENRNQNRGRNSGRSIPDTGSVDQRVATDINALRNSVTTMTGIPDVGFGTNTYGGTVAGTTRQTAAPIYDEFGRRFGAGYVG